MKCPRCNSSNIRFEKRTTVDRWVCATCRWIWFYWPGREGKAQ